MKDVKWHKYNREFKMNLSEVEHKLKQDATLQPKPRS